MDAMNATTAELIDSLKFPSYTTDDTQTMATAANEIEYLVARTQSDEGKLESQAQTIERLTRELDETRAEVTRLNALINTPQPVITGIWRRSVI